jgi:hypothetical protein
MVDTGLLTNTKEEQRIVTKQVVPIVQHAEDGKAGIY